MSRPTQQVRVLRALRRTGMRGITAVDFALPDVIDGGPPIARVASRIDELRQAGHRIEVRGRRRRSRCAIYVLRQDAPPPASLPSAHGAPTEPVLFESPPPTPRSAVDGDCGTRP